MGVSPLQLPSRGSANLVPMAEPRANCQPHPRMGEVLGHLSQADLQITIPILLAISLKQAWVCLCKGHHSSDCIAAIAFVSCPAICKTLRLEDTSH